MQFAYRRFLNFLPVVMAALSASAFAASAPADADLIEQGRYLATASDCAACHTAKNGKPFGGGLAISSPVGTIYASNITPSTSSGIGNYTEAEFSRALREGIRSNGANLYPAMPYTSYAALSNDDVHALYTYFMQGVAPVNVKAPETKLPFPMNLRMSMKGWNLIFLDKDHYQNDPSKSAEWNRGHYLVSGAAHCSACHTPRGFLMGEETSKALSGGQVGAWFAPNITSDPVDGIGTWTQEDIVTYLHTGKLRGRAQAAGSMGEAVEHSFQYLSPQDLNAIATYMKTVPAIRNSTDLQSRYGRGTPVSAVATVRGVPYSGNVGGDALFLANCASCHSASAQGSKDGYYPSLYHNSVTGASNPNNLIAAILYGVDRTTAKGQAYMPGFGSGPHDLNALSDKDIASLASYVRAAYGEQRTPVTAEQVAMVRQGGPSSNLLDLARWGMGMGVAFVLLVGLFLIRRFSRRRNRLR